MPLLVFGGIGAGLGVLGPLVDAIDPAIAVLRIDPPGIGGSPTPVVPYSMSSLAWSVGQVLDQLGYPEADVLGYSWGGALAQQFALQQAARCRRLVLVSTSTGVLCIPGDPLVYARMLTPRYLSTPQEALSVIGLAASPGPVPPLPATLPAGTGYLYQLAAIAAWTSLPFLPFLRQPTLVLSGDDDPIVPVANARLLARLLPHAHLEVFRGGHGGVISDAPALGRWVSEFVRA